jgi:transposase-like protein
LGVSVALSKAEVHRRTFLQSLIQRGRCGVTHITSDDHSGLQAARTAVFPSVPWQRCQFHLQQNAQAYVPRLDLRAEVARAIRSVFDSPNRPAAERRLKEVVAHYAPSAPQRATWMEENLPQGLTVFALPVAHQKSLRTSNALERVNQEIKRRTRVARLFPNESLPSAPGHDFAGRNQRSMGIGENLPQHGMPNPAPILMPNHFAEKKLPRPRFLPLLPR